MSLDYILLGLLQRPTSGYALKADIDEGVRYFWSADLAQIYPTLQAMEKRGWLTSRQEPSPQGPPRRVYRRTAAGTRALRHWLREEPIMGVERFAYIAQLLFHHQLGDYQSTLRFMQQLRKKQAALLQVLERTLGEIISSVPSADPVQLPSEEFHGWLSAGLGVNAVRARIAWCDAVIPTIQRRLSSERRRKRP